MLYREELERREYEILSEKAAKSAASRGRLVSEEKCDLRTEFQRDRDRILHSKSFRRLMHKTQVFLAPEGDHFRTRLTHTLEVAQIARTISRGLNLNEDLTEAIALGHDLGHTPFGHNGEEILNKIHLSGFKHNVQSLRVVDVLENTSSRRGLNLTQEVRDGIVNHTGSKLPFTLEGQIVRISDRIAYINHDIDDAVRGGILKEEDLPSEYTDILGHSSKARLNRMVHDVITQSMDRPEIHMSDEVWKAMRGLRQYLFEHVYLNPVAKGEEAKVMHMITNLYHIYMEKPELMPEQFLNMLENGTASREQIACDYIAGMTDSYAVHTFEEYFIPKCWKN